MEDVRRNVLTDWDGVARGSGDTGPPAKLDGRLSWRWAEIESRGLKYCGHGSVGGKGESEFEELSTSKARPMGS